MESALRDLVADAVRVQQTGLRVKKPAPPTRRDYPDELSALMEADPAFRDAFERLTPGRQRGYLLHFNGAKQSATRAARIERVQDRIMDGFELHDYASPRCGRSWWSAEVPGGRSTGAVSRAGALPRVR
jgi:uncharacterized protein YdeI (YjbR/CyaY-like superfamily)